MMLLIFVTRWFHKVDWVDIRKRCIIEVTKQKQNIFFSIYLHVSWISILDNLSIERCFSKSNDRPALPEDAVRYPIHFILKIIVLHNFAN